MNVFQLPRVIIANGKIIWNLHEKDVIYKCYTFLGHDRVLFKNSLDHSFYVIKYLK